MRPISESRSKRIPRPTRRHGRRFRRRYPEWVLFIGLVIAVSAVTGCGPDISPVTGTARLDGNPVGPGVILFLPDQSQGNEGKAAAGKFGPDGVYTLMTHEDGDGALVGHHRVVIRGAPGGGDTAEPVADRPVGPITSFAESGIPRKYSSVQNPLLSAEVVKGGSTINFDLRAGGAQDNDASNR